MKKLSQLVVCIIVAWGFITTANAWDVYIYNKTPKRAHFTVYNSIFGQHAQCGYATLDADQNRKVTSGFYGLNCITYVHATANDVNLETNGRDALCENRRVELKVDNNGGYYLDWQKQW